MSRARPSWLRHAGVAGSSVAGFPAVRGRDLVAGLAAQADRYTPMYALGEEASALDYMDGLPVVTASSGVSIRAKFVVVTGGIGTFMPRRLGPLDAFEGSGLAYFVPQPDDYRGKDVVVVGGGDSAFDWALTLAPLARSLTLMHRRDASAHTRHWPEEWQVHCIYEGDRKLYINPVECIDCGACEPVYPQSAIHVDWKAPADMNEFVGDNARFFTEALPGRPTPIGSPGGSGRIGRIGEDTATVRSWRGP
jgi:NAD-dependent dihydropyrimidine dehydrogenase PreA subunit